MAMTIPQAVATVRRVFNGGITREQTASLSRREQVLIGLAIMLALPDEYLDDIGDGKLHPRGNAMAGILRHLMVRGMLDDTDSHGAYVGDTSLLGACRTLGLYAPNRNGGRGQVFTLTPPPELQALVDELGATPAVHAFKEAADAAKAAKDEEDRRRRERYEARVAKLRALIEPLTEYERDALRQMLDGEQPYFFD